jgi:myo-inositol 2-dehydrogenase / D-chiro-inositol 1-dehydrogenase
MAKKQASSVSRRDFVKNMALGTAGALLLKPSGVAGAAAEGGQALRVGFIGVGGRGTHLLSQVLSIDGVEVAAVCDINPGNLRRAQRMVEERSGKRPDGIGDTPYDYRKLLARKDLDCVVVATPCYWHSTMYMDAINAGKHFYGEKPLAITAWGLKEVNDAYRRNPNVVVQIGFQWGADRRRADVIEKVHNGLIGQLLEGRFHRYNGWDGHGGWYADRAQSGDWMLEQAVHEFNLIWWVTQTHPISCFAAGRSGIIPGRNTTNYYHAVLQYPEKLNNLVVHYGHGWIHVSGFPDGGLKADFIGEKGALNVMDAYVQLREAPAGGSARINGEGPSGDTREHFLNFFESVRAGTPETANCGIANGTGGSIIGLLIRQSLEEKRVVTLEETLRDTRKPPVPPA